MEKRFSVMERRWVGDAMRLVVMDWEKAEIITLMTNDLEGENVDKELVAFIHRMIPILEKPLWKSYYHQITDRPSDESHL